MSTETSKYQSQIVPSEYGGGYQIVNAAPVREPPRVAPPVSRDAICKKYQLTDVQFAWLCAHQDFPKPITSNLVVRDFGASSADPLRDGAKVAEFFAMGRQIFGGR